MILHRISRTVASVADTEIGSAVNHSGGATRQPVV